MTTWPAYLKRAIFSGTAGSITSSLALAAMAKIERKGPLQPVNAKSHWLHGEAAAEKRALDDTHIPVILMSDYSHVLAQNGRDGFELLHKPYSIEQLSRVFRKSITWQNR